MRWRPGHLALILFQAFWLNVVLPGHTRGAVTLPGFCGALDRTCCRHEQPPKGEMPARRVANCAICAFAARMTPAVVVDFTPPRLGLIGLLPALKPHAVDWVEFLPTIRGRAPPACA